MTRRTFAGQLRRIARIATAVLPAPNHYPSLVVSAATFALCALVLLGTPRSQAQEVRGRVLIDSFSVNDTPVALANGYPVPYVSDCDPGESPPRCGSPPAQWSMSLRPVPMCTFIQNLPGWLTPEQFRQFVRDAADVWNHVEAAIGILYTGDCPGTQWERRDGVNQIAFDDARNVISGATLGLTESSISWAPPASPTLRRIDEADIIVESNFADVPTCLLSTITHEMGHALGFGHSTNPDDLMYASVDLSHPETCHLTPTGSEQERLQDLYGVNGLPAVSLAGEQAVPVGLQMNLQATGEDPEGEPLSYEWEQLSGQPVELIDDGPAASFLAPNGAGILEFRVTARDPYLHPASATTHVTTYVSQGHLTYGQIPSAGGFELVIFAGGTNLDLVVASGCPLATAAFWTTDDAGEFVIYLPASTVAVVNASWNEKFAGNIPEGTPLLGRCQ